MKAGAADLEFPRDRRNLRSIVATVRGLPPAPRNWTVSPGDGGRRLRGQREVEVLAGTLAQIVAPGGGGGAVRVLERCGAGVGPDRFGQRLESGGQGSSPGWSFSGRAGDLPMSA